jgi:hypothetical protein
MKSITSLIMPALSFGLCISLSSCEKESLPVPDQVSTSENTHSLTADNGMPKKLTLIQQGEVTFTYNPNGCMARATTSPGFYTEYAYGTNFVIDTRYRNQVKRDRYVYWLNSAGKCYQDVHTTYSPQGSKLDETTYLYEYYANGQLKKQYNQAKVNEGIGYTYNADGDLQRVIFYLPDGTPSAIVTYAYTASAFDRKLADKYLQNPLFYNTGFNSPYLSYIYPQLFGQFNKHLVKRITYQFEGRNSPHFDQSFQYTRTQDGYVLDRLPTDLLLHRALEPVHYSYAMINIGVGK